MLRFTDITLGATDEPHCRRCRGSEPGTLRDKDDIRHDILAAVQSWGAEPGPNLVFTGSEPLRYPDLRQLVADAVGAGAQRVCLDTDCAELTPDTARQLLHDGVRQIRYTLLGSNGMLHDALLGSHGSFDSTMKGVAAFLEAAGAAEAGVHLEARVAACRHNLQDLPEVVTTAARAGAHSLRLVVDDVGLDLRSAAPWFEAACDSGIVNTIWVEVEGVPYGIANGWELHLAPMYREVEGAHSERCVDCALADVCPGAIKGAGDSVLKTFGPPPDAERLLGDIRRSHQTPLCCHT